VHFCNYPNPIGEFHFEPINDKLATRAMFSAVLLTVHSIFPEETGNIIDELVL